VGRASDRVHRVTLPSDAPRIDRALAELLSISRTRVQSLIAAGRVAVEGRVVQRPSEPVPAGALVVVEEEIKREPTLLAEAIPLVMLYEDDDCLVVDKPAGMVVHPGAGNPSGTLVHALLHHRPEVAGVGRERRAGLVHRLDKDTSGCLIVAKHDAAHRALADQFAARTVEKTYWAFVWGHMPAAEGVIDRPIGRSTGDRQRMTTRARRSRPAVTRWRVLERYAIAEWVEAHPETGRTHQVRVHLAESGHPLLGDARYGGGDARARGFHGPQRAWAREAAEAAARQALHARALAFDQPVTGERVRVESPLPADLVTLRETLRLRAG
jgi:23S rRNA pseudouridine1911/1915/1917 synthase